MTAIFAYTNGQHALIASDSLRADPLGLLPTRAVQKIYAWSPKVLFGQTGTGDALDELANAMLDNKCNFDSDVGGFCDAFNRHRPTILKSNRDKAGRTEARKNLVRGVLLVVVPKTTTCCAQIFSLDFVTGERKELNSRLATEGSVPKEYEIAAKKQLDNFVQNGTSLPSDVWAANCINEAISICPKFVGWPMKMIFSYPNSCGEHSHIEKCIENLPIVPDRNFSIALDATEPWY